jgi:cytochrome c-type biogenesis protein CcmH
MNEISYTEIRGGDVASLREIHGEEKKGRFLSHLSANLRAILRESPRHLLKILLLPLALLLISGQVYAQRPVSEVTDNEVNAVASDMFCPTCENIPLDVCPTQACADWRQIIREQLAEGRSKEEIIDYFVERYGEQVRSAPPRYGVFWYFWLMPIVGVGVAAVFFGRYVWHLQKQSAQRPSTKVKPPVESVATDDYLARVEKELRKKDE